MVAHILSVTDNNVINVINQMKYVSQKMAEMYAFVKTLQKNARGNYVMEFCVTMIKNVKLLKAVKLVFVRTLVLFHQIVTAPVAE